MATIVQTTFKLRRGTLNEWESKNPILALAEPGFAYDKGILKIGDGEKTWKELENIVEISISPDQTTIAYNLNNQLTIAGSEEAKAGYIPIKNQKNEIEWISKSNLGKNCQNELKGYYWFNLDLDNKTFTLSSTQMINTPVTEFPWSFSENQECWLSISDESNAFTNYCKVISVSNGIVQVENLPDIEDIRNKIPEDHEHLYSCDFAVWCIDEPTIGAVDLSAGAHVIGKGNIVRGMGTFASGHLTQAIGPFSESGGLRTVASGERSHAEGSDTIAAASCAHAEGFQSKALVPYAHAEGAKTEVYGDAGHAEGYQTKAFGRSAHSEGRVTEARGSESHTEGWHTVANGDCQHVEGQYNIEDNGTNTKTPLKQGKYIHIAGNGTNNNPSNAYTLDWYGNAWFAGKINIGPDNLELATQKYANDLFASRYITAGKNNNTNLGSNATAEGLMNEASARYAHAEGFHTRAIEQSTHSEGEFTVASGRGAHAEGLGNENKQTTASGNAAHAEGFQTTASGDNAHAEGRATVASGYKSHAEGWNTVATEDSQHVQGKYNELDKNGSAGNYAHVVGNGTSATKRTNAHTLDWDGNAWYQGSVECSGVILTSPNGTKYKLLVNDDGTLYTSSL